MGNFQTHVLKKRLIKGNQKSIIAMKKLLKNQYSFQVLKLKNERDIMLFEHFAIAILDPRLNK